VDDLDYEDDEINEEGGLEDEDGEMDEDELLCE
jgi:hypothetical protein